MVYTPSALSLENALRAETGRAGAAPLSARSHHRPGPSRRIYEMSWLRRDGAVENARQSAPAKPAFEAAFSAFARGTMIATSTGVVAVEDLRPGMQIVTHERGPSPLLWVGSMSLMPEEGDDTPPLTRVMADAFGMGRPMPDFLAGPGARLMQNTAGFTEQTLRPMHDFQDGMNVIAVRPPSPVQLYHIALHRHATITVAGLTAETFHPGPGFENIMSHEICAQFMALFPHMRRPTEFGGLAHPRQPLHRRGLDAA